MKRMRHILRGIICMLLVLSMLIPGESSMAYTENRYTMTYYVNGGVGFGDEGTYKVVVADTDVVTDTFEVTMNDGAEIEREGYTLLGWDVNKSLDVPKYKPGETYTFKKSDFGYDGQSNWLPMYAIWKENDYTITYDANGGDNAPAMQIKKKNVSATISEDVPTRAGYTFLGWDTKANSDKATINPGDKYKENASITLYAVWEAKQYKVTYNIDGNTNKVAAESVDYDGGVSATNYVPKKEGYTFVGWSTEKNGTQVNYFTGNYIVINQNITLYPVWEKKTKKTTKKVKQKIKAKSFTVTRTNDKFSLGGRFSSTGNGKLTYKSSNKKILKVDSKGKATIAGYGKVKLTICAAARGKYKAATKKITVTVLPKKLGVAKVFKQSEDEIYFSWTADDTVEGYECQVSSSKDMNTKASLTKDCKSKNDIILDGMQADKTYYVRVRAYAKYSGKKLYGAWSTTMSIKM